MDSTDFALILQLIASFTLIIGYIPHVMHVLNRRSAADHSILGWVVWLFASFVFLIYAMIVGSTFVLLVQFITIVMIIVMLALVVKYRKK